MGSTMIYYLLPPSERIKAALLRCLSRTLYTPAQEVAPTPPLLSIDITFRPVETCHHEYELSRVGLRCRSCLQHYYTILHQLAHEEVPHA